ncbi:S1 RNA-binding domain-containing protein, partial [Roseburia faecis]|nr:S1 RNA-binding domain-containing protein [Roseburia faecis]
MALVGRRHHHIFQIGQPVKVKLIRVDKDQREVDFELVNPEEAPTTKLRVPRKNDGRFNGRGR